MRALNTLTAVEAAAAIASGRVTAEALVRACLERIAIREPDVRAWAFIDPDQAIAAARACDRSPAGGLLRGLPVGVKDVIDTVDLPTGYGTSFYAGSRPPWDAACVAAVRAAGALVLGKTVSTELANRHPAGTRNPRDLAHTPGGSSSGSGAAVADDMVPLAFGTQTGGSLIRPAAYCGVVGYKPTHGAIPVAGVKALSASLDTVGVYGRTVPDAALMGAVTIGFAPIEFRSDDAKGLRIGVFRTPQWEMAEPAMKQAFEDAASRLATAGARVAEVPTPAALANVVEVAGIVNDYETARAFAYECTHHAAAFSPTLAQKLEESTRWTYERYLAALSAARVARFALDEILRNHDVLITPSATGEAPRGHASIGPAAFQGMWTLLHTPAVSVPAFTGPNGLPMGLQVIGPRWQDERALLAAHAIHRTLA